MTYSKLFTKYHLNLFLALTIFLLKTTVLA